MIPITSTMKVGIVARRFPETDDVFEWHDIDANDRRHATLEEISEELDLDIETFIDELTQALLDDPDADDDEGDEDEFEEDEAIVDTMVLADAVGATHSSGEDEGEESVVPELEEVG